MKKNKLTNILKNIDKIVEGAYNNFVPTELVKVVREKRLNICRSNKCGMYDPNGESENAIMKNTESCGSCGCVLTLKTACLSCSCPENYWGEIKTENEKETLNETDQSD